MRPRELSGSSGVRTLFEPGGKWDAAVTLRHRRVADILIETRTGDMRRRNWWGQDDMNQSQYPSPFGVSDPPVSGTIHPTSRTLGHAV